MSTESTDPTACEGQDLLGVKAQGLCWATSLRPCGAVSACEIMPSRKQIEELSMDLGSLLAEQHPATATDFSKPAPLPATAAA